jgi:pimeloyl-ACP methyl ester carboxylesterase
MESNLRNAVIGIAVVVIIAAVALFRGRGGDDTPAPSGEPVTEDLTGESVTDSAPGPDGRLVDVGGHRLLVRTFGAGSPAVVIEPGIGDPGQVWGAVVDSLSGDYRVVLYSRAGYAGSEPGPMPRSADRVVRELTQLLVDTPIEPPYVVVGHSLGCIHALLYASENPHVVDGLVLLDPPPLAFIKGERFPELQEMAEDMTAGFRRDAQEARSSGDVAMANQLEAVASEHEQMFESGWSWVESVASLGEMPLVVVASGQPNPNFGDSAEEFQEFWRDSTEELAMLSSRSRYLYVEDSSHDIPGDAPGTVVEAVRWCLDQPDLDDVYGDVWEGDK